MSSVTASEQKTSKGLHVGLWVVQGLLALAFLGAGALKLTTPSAELIAQGMTWIESFPGFAVPVIGGLEVLGALGLVLPAALRIQPKLTVLAALGLVLTMVGAAITHIAIGEAGMIAPNVVLGGLAAFVAWGRWSKAPIEAR
jgi:uncharacterized membrane protein YphA (DoxX/SURF4 family)